MLFHAKNVIGGKVVDVSTLSVLGRIGDVIIDPDTGSILAVLLERGFLAKQKIVSWYDVVSWYDDGVLIRSADCALDSSEIARVQKVLDDKIFLLGSGVITQKGRRLGRLDDFVFDTTTSYLVTIIVKKFFFGETRIMSSNRILSILKDKVIIRDIIEGEKYKVKKEDLVIKKSAATN